jgi:hypothetical protein
MYGEVGAKLDALNELCRAHWESGRKDFTPRTLAQEGKGSVPVRESLAGPPYADLRRVWALHAGGWASTRERILPTLTPEMSADEVLRLVKEYVISAQVSVKSLMVWTFLPV